MYPVTIHQWFLDKGIDFRVGWEALDESDPGLGAIHTEADLQEALVNWIITSIDIAADDSDTLRSLFIHVMPLLGCLSADLVPEEREAILEAADKVGGVGVYGVVRTIIYG